MTEGKRFSGRMTLAFQVTDRRASARWYEGMLGCRLLYDGEELGWCELTSPIADVSFGLSDQGPVATGGPVPTLEVADIDATRSFLEEQGVRFEGATLVHDGFVKLATFFDPDGNRLMLAEDLQGGGA